MNQISMEFYSYAELQKGVGDVIEQCTFGESNNVKRDCRIAVFDYLEDQAPDLPLITAAALFEDGYKTCFRA